jgi:thiamine-phosphate pyrophosphorylase
MLVLMTDDERLADPLRAAMLLPRGAMIIVRSRDHARRAAWAHALVALGRTRGLLILIANDASLASRCGADGVHLSDTNARQAAHWRAVRPHWFISAAAHSLRTATLTHFVDALILSPIFPTPSHPKAVALTAARANAIAHASRLPVYALGGVTACNAPLLHGHVGIAAIGALQP